MNPASMTSARRRRLLGLALVFAAAYLALTRLVVTGRTVALDQGTYQVFRPDGVWGATQELFGRVIDVLGPVMCWSVLLTVAAYSALRQRSWMSLLLMAALTVPTVLVILGTKEVVDRVDPAGGFVPGRGAYPSGHSAAILLCAAGVAMLIERPVRWWALLLVAALCVLMAVSLLWIGMHWLSDVVGGTLVGLTVLTLASLLPVQGLRSPSGASDEAPPGLPVRACDRCVRATMADHASH